MTIKRNSTYMQVKFKVGEHKDKVLDAFKFDDGWHIQEDGKWYYCFISHLRNDNLCEILFQC